MRWMMLSATALALAACGDQARDCAPAPAASAEAAAQPNLFLLYTLQDGVSPADFERWVVETDYPAMRGLARVQDFRAYRAERLLIGEGTPGVAYIEAFTIPDLDGFVAEDMGGDTVQSVIGQFMGFVEAPQFIVVAEVK